MRRVPLELISGPANAGKAHAVLERFRAQLARGREPILVVPTDADQARYRRELVEGGVTVGARVERFAGLLSEVVGRASASSERTLGAFARERALAGIAGSASPGFAPALAELIAELEVARVSPARLREAVKAAKGTLQAASFLASSCELYAAYRELLRKANRSDRELRATKALDELRRRPAPWGQTPVLLYGFDSFTELELDTIETLGAVVDAPVTVTLAYEPGRSAFAGRAEAFERLRPLAERHVMLPAQSAHYAAGSREALHHVERFLLEPTPPRRDAGEAVALLEGASPRAELELVAGEVRALLDAGAKAQEIAIVHRSPEAVAGLLGEVLDDFAIPHALIAGVRAGDTAIGRALVGLIRCAGPGGQLADLLAWLRAPGVLERQSLADALEAKALRRGVGDADAARRLWEEDHWPLERIDRLREAAEDPRSLTGILSEELERLFCAPRRRMAAVLAEEELPEARAVAAIGQALEELADLAGWAPELVPGLSLLAELLAALALPGNERPADGRVVVSDPLSLRARRVKALFLCGLQEGVFPAWAPPRSSLLGEDDRRALAQASGLVLPRERDALAAERYLLYAVCSRPEERLTLSWHTASEDGSPVSPSLFLDDVCDLFDDRLRERTRRRSAAAVAWPGPGRPAGAMAARASALARGGRLREPVIAPLGDVSILADLGERKLWSASSLETWTACPVRWLVERLLCPEDLEGDAEPLARGTLAHAVLRETLERLGEERGSARLTEASLGRAKRIMAESLEHNRAHHLSGLASELALAVARRLQVDLERYLEQAAESESPLEPTHFELEFGGGEGGLPALELAEDVSVRGRMDRVDLGPSGEAIVYDYKGRTAPPGAKWASDGALQVALYMEAVERLLDAEAVGGFYQPLAGKELKARGVLNVDAGVSLDCVRTDRRSEQELRETLLDCRQAALAAARQARAGALEPRPRTCGYGGGCMYPEICRCET